MQISNTHSNGLIIKVQQLHLVLLGITSTTKQRLIVYISRQYIICNTCESNVTNKLLSTWENIKYLFVQFFNFDSPLFLFWVKYAFNIISKTKVKFEHWKQNLGNKKHFYKIFPLFLKRDSKNHLCTIHI